MSMTGSVNGNLSWIAKFFGAIWLWKLGKPDWTLPQAAEEAKLLWKEITTNE